MSHARAGSARLDRIYMCACRTNDGAIALCVQARIRERHSVWIRQQLSSCDAMVGCAPWLVHGNNGTLIVCRPSSHNPPAVCQEALLITAKSANYSQRNGSRAANTQGAAGRPVEPVSGSAQATKGSCAHGGCAQCRRHASRARHYVTTEMCRLPEFQLCSLATK